MSDIHEIAFDYLREIERGNSFYSETPIEVQHNTTMTGLVALRRFVSPHYFYGWKPSGTAVFTHDIRLAKSFDAQHPSLDEHVGRLILIGHAVDPHPTVWSEGRNVNE